MSILDSDGVTSQNRSRSENSWKKCASQGSMRYCVEAIVVSSDICFVALRMAAGRLLRVSSIFAPWHSKSFLC